MRPTPGDFIRLHLANLDALDVIQLLIGLLMLASVVAGTIALVRSWRNRREDGFVRTMSPLRRWIGATTALSLLACVLAVAGMAYHQWVSQYIVQDLGWNVTPADVSGPSMDVNLGLAFGLLIGAVGLALGWTLEWFADGLTGPLRVEEES